MSTQYRLCGEFIDVNQSLSMRPEQMNADHALQFETLARAFVKNFRDLYPSKHVTPYMHCMMNHVSEFMELHGSILPFTQQGLEKYNDTMTKDYFRATSHKGEQCLIQILQKQNRMEYLEANGAKRAKRYDIMLKLQRRRPQPTNLHSAMFYLPGTNLLCTLHWKGQNPCM